MIIGRSALAKVRSSKWVRIVTELYGIITGITGGIVLAVHHLWTLLIMIPGIIALIVMEVATMARRNHPK